ncbi:hypothetical protein TNCV_3784421 [Trichonephila clavipes]|nr:hypothetical protein TNCV_3784421 [Trichonephila clavipes]
MQIMKLLTFSPPLSTDFIVVASMMELRTQLFPGHSELRVKWTISNKKNHQKSMGPRRIWLSPAYPDPEPLGARFWCPTDKSELQITPRCFRLRFFRMHHPSTPMR